MKIVFPDETACIRSSQDVAPLKELGECVVYDTNPQSERELIRRIKDAEVAIINLSEITANIMGQCQKLGHICFLGIGVESYVDIARASERGIWVTNTPGYGNNTVAEYALGLLLCAARKIHQGDRELRQNIWEQRELEGVELWGKTLGIIGLGPIGARMAELGNTLGMRVLCYTRRPNVERARKHGVEFTDLEHLLGKSDFVSLHIASSKETYHLMDAAQFQIMKKTAIFINTARGELVNTESLHEALRAGQIAGAALDVYEEEPLPRNHPLLKLDNVVITPHIAYNSREAGKRMLDIAIANVASFAKGKPLNLVNKQVLTTSIETPRTQKCGMI